MSRHLRAQHAQQALDVLGHLLWSVALLDVLEIELGEDDFEELEVEGVAREGLDLLDLLLRS